eukprot:TRINITY_DN3833_c1_g9_i2.p1 TRINITY_DN3833_c1_g9~~TRINITY_DN3833_c1_g9_i2.p1  ORF type:complete len:168 (+),score=52.78 TRINITY_DN3833_c1_g9_i2:256-759(+)
MDINIRFLTFIIIILFILSVVNCGKSRVVSSSSCGIQGGPKPGDVVNNIEQIREIQRSQIEKELEKKDKNKKDNGYKGKYLTHLDKLESEGMDVTELRIEYEEYQKKQREYRKTEKGRMEELKLKSQEKLIRSQFEQMKFWDKTDDDNNENKNENKNENEKRIKDEL